MKPRKARVSCAHDGAGNVLSETNFPYTNSSEMFDGPLAAGTIGNIDSDPAKEIGALMVRMREGVLEERKC